MLCPLTRSLSGDTKNVLTGSADNSCRLWDCETGRYKCIDFSVRKCQLSIWSSSLWLAILRLLTPAPLSPCAAQVNSWPCSTPTLLSERAALTSAATSSCSPQTSRWVTSVSWTSLTWGIHSRLVHTAQCSDFYLAATLIRLLGSCWLKKNGRHIQLLPVIVWL